VKRRQPRAQRKCVDASVVGIYQRAWTHVQRLRAALERLEGRRNVRSAPYFEHLEVKADFTGCGLNLRYFQHRAGIVDIADDRESAQIGERLAQDLESLAGKVDGLNRDAGGIAAWSH
jgi:hypothetical protein